MALEFSTEFEMTDCVIALNVLRNKQMARDPLATTRAQVLAQVFKAKMVYIAMKRLAVQSAPIMLVVGMLSYCRKLKLSNKRLKKLNAQKIQTLEGSLNRLCRAETRSGVITEDQFRALKSQFLIS